MDVDDPRTFVVAPGYDDLWKAAWCGVKVRKPMTWVKMTYPDKFDKVVADEEENHRESGEKVPTDDIELEGEYVTVYEIWVRDSEVEEYIVKPEKRMANEEGEEIVIEEEERGTRKKHPKGMIVTMTEGVLLEERESPFAHGKPPWVVFYDYRIPHDFWGMCEPMQIEELNREFNLRLQTLVRHAHRTQDPNYFLNASSNLDPEKIKDEMLAGGNIWTVPYIGDDLIQQVPEAQINASHLQLLEGIPTLIEEISGVTDISKGMAAKRERQSASEVSILIESSYTRTRQRVRNLEWSISRLWYLIVELMQQFYTEARTVSYKEDGQTVWMYAGNSPQVAQEASKPMRKPEEPEGEYANRVATDDDYQYIVREYLGNDPVHIDFDIEVQTNSMLPMDKQSLANLFLRLAEVHITPDSPITMEAILEMLRVPNKEKILKDKQKQMQMMMMQGAAK